jgi:integrase
VAAVLLASLTGVDRGPMFAWEWAEHVDFEAGHIVGWRRKGTGIVRTHPVPMSDYVVEVLRRLAIEQQARFGKRSRWVFPNATNTGHLHEPTFIEKVFDPALIAAGIHVVTERRKTERVRAELFTRNGRRLGWRTVEKVTRGVERNFRWKDLRHTFGTNLRMSGVDLLTIANLLGNTTTRMAEVYAHATPSHLREAVASLPGRVAPPTLQLPEPAPALPH